MDRCKQTKLASHCHLFVLGRHLIILQISFEFVLAHSVFIPLQILKEKIEFGLTLEGPIVDNHLDIDRPVDVVYAYKHSKHLDDHF